MIHVIAYDIGDDRRRDQVSAILSACGARVQLSVFECELPDPISVAELRRAILHVIDPDEDQVRVYQLDRGAETRTTVLGNRRLEERADFFIV